MYFNETGHNESLLSTDDSDNTEKATAVQKWRSATDDWKNLVNGASRKPVKRFQPNLTQNISTMGPQTG